MSRIPRHQVAADRVACWRCLRRTIPSVLFPLLVVVFGAAAEPVSLTLVQTIALPGVEGRIDHFGLDAAAHRLYVAALGNNTVEVVDLAAGKVVHHLTGLKEPQGVAVIPDPHQVVVANGDDGTVNFYDAESYQLLHSIALQGDADNVRYDLLRRTIYVGFGNGGIAVIDPAMRAIVATIALPAHPEAFALEPDGTRLFVNVPSAGAITVVDRATRSTVATWDLAKGYADFFSSPSSRCHANFPMSLDATHHRLFIGCRKPARMLVFDTQAGKPVAELEVSGDTDDLYYDQASAAILVSCGEGFIDVIAQTDPDHYQRTARIATATGARTSAWVAETRQLYLAVPHHGAQPAALMIFRAGP